MKRALCSICAGVLLAAPGFADAQALPPLQDLSATRDRPVFAPDRRPPPPPAPTRPAAAAPAVVPALPSPPPNLVLSGVILGDRNLALLKRPSDPKPKAFGLGQYVDGWMLARIEGRRVLFIKDNRETWVEMLGHR